MMLRRGAMLGGLIAGLVWAMTGCAGAPMMAKDSMEAPASASKTSAAEEIESLIRDIERHGGSYREEFGVEADMPGNAGGAATGEHGPESDAPTPNCETVCSATEAICFSSQRICAISSRFGDDLQFAERCTWSTGECAKAKPMCEGCGD